MARRENRTYLMGWGSIFEMSSSVTQLAASGDVKDTWNRPLRDLRISVIDRCNYRCPYCMPDEVYGDGYEFLPRRHWLTPGEIKRVAGLFMQLGVTKLRVTGGEPLLRKDIVEIVSGLKELPGLDLALTTNGALLAGLAGELKAAGLNRITISLDSLDDAVFKQMSGEKGNITNVLEGIEAARIVGLSPIKLNVVVQKGKNDHTVLDLVDHFRGSGAIVRFIEYMDVGTLNGWRLDEVVTSKVLMEQIDKRWSLKPVEPNYRGEVAQRYVFEDGQGEIGFISSVTKPFCGSCSRARLSSDGKLYNCLFASTGQDVKPWLTEGLSDHEIQQRIYSIWSERADRYSELRAQNLTEVGKQKVEMYYIGG